MAIDLKKTDVVIVGLGAVGGVAALPLTRAGLDVIGIEAGTWLSPRDFAPASCATISAAGRNPRRRRTARSRPIAPTRRRPIRRAFPSIP
ncbi:MAG: hypothetical protein ACXWJL_11760 [Xanthobacteraceae bacterium]